MTFSTRRLKKAFLDWVKERKYFGLLIITLFAGIFIIPWADLMLVLPQLQSIDKHQFRLAFYTGLYSGTIYSTFTGILVGYIVFSLHRKEDERNARERCLEEFQSFANELSSVLTLDQSPVYDDLILYNAKLKKVHGLITVAPLINWNKHLKNRTIRALNTFMTAYLKMQEEGNLFKTEVKKHSDFAISERSFLDTEDKLIAIIHGRLINKEMKDLLAILQLDAEETWIGEWYQAISENSEFKSCYQKYLRQRELMDRALKRLEFAIADYRAA